MGKQWYYCKAICLIVLGLVLAANEYWAWADTWYVLSAILVIMGVVHLFMPSNCCMEEKAAVRKKK